MFDVTVSAIVPKHLFDGQDYRRRRRCRSRSAPGRSSSPNGSAATSSSWSASRILEAGPALSGRHHLPRGAGQPEPPPGAGIRPGQLTQSNDIEPFDVPQMRARPNLEVKTTGWEYMGPLMWVEIQPPREATGRRAGPPALTMAVEPGFHRPAPVVRHRQASDRPVPQRHTLLRRQRQGAGLRRRGRQGAAGRSRAEAERPGRTLHHQAHVAALWRGLHPPGRVPAPVLPPGGRRPAAGKRRMSAPGPSARRTGISIPPSTTSTSMATRRWAWSAATSPPTSRRSCSPTSPATPTRRWTSCSPRAACRGPEGAPGSLQRRAEDPGERRAAALADGNVLPHHLRQEAEQRDHHRRWACTPASTTSSWPDGAVAVSPRILAAVWSRRRS
jgi:hypothetical protein